MLTRSVLARHRHLGVRGGDGAGRGFDHVDVAADLRQAREDGLEQPLQQRRRVDEDHPGGASGQRFDADGAGTGGGCEPGPLIDAWQTLTAIESGDPTSTASAMSMPTTGAAHRRPRCISPISGMSGSA